MVNSKKDWRPFIYGGFASAVAETGTFPIDTTKTRLQVQGQVVYQQFKDVKYRGMFHALYRIRNEEGVRALYSGVKPAILRQMTYGTIKFGIYYSLKSAFIKDKKDDTMAKSVMCAVLAGVIGSSIANPTDVLKIRMQAQQSVYSHKGMFRSFLEIYRVEGLAGLWKGVLPTSQRAAVCAGVELPVYDITKKHLVLHTSLEDNVYCHFISSFMAGLAGALASTPIDVVRTRIMNQGNSRNSGLAYKGVIDCAIKTIKTEGVKALYKGFVPNWVRLGPWNIIFFLVYEQLKLHY